MEMYLFQFVYVNQAFAPAPDVDIGTLYDVSFFLWKFYSLIKCFLNNLSLTF